MELLETTRNFAFVSFVDIVRRIMLDKVGFAKVYKNQMKKRTEAELDQSLNKALNNNN